MYEARSALLILIVLFGFGCAKATYAPPVHQASLDDHSIVLAQPFNEVWKTLISYSASTFFAIDNYEKDSGLITLSFGSSNAAEFITGGRWVVTTMNGSYDGDYVDYFVKYARATLSGRMNIVVAEVEPQKTRVTVNARYIFSIPPNNNFFGETWSFDSGSCCTINVKNAARGTTSQRTICPTYKAEKAVLNALNK